jgi:predicted nucleotidyltransferase
MNRSEFEAITAEVVARLVDFYRPDKIYLFGSAARGEVGVDSDLDFLVVVPDGAPKGLLQSGEIYCRLRGIEVPVDVVPWRRTDFEGRAAHVRASLPATVLREGKLVYDAESVPA